MILADTAVWVDHLRRGEPTLRALLEDCAILIHPFVIGEILLGSLAKRGEVLEMLVELPAAMQAEDSEVLDFISAHGLHSQGIGYMDAHLLASVALTPGSVLWTRDKRLHAAAESLQCAFSAHAPL